MPTPPQGRFVWFDLMARDVNAAAQFLAQVTGWTVAQTPGPDGTPYTTLRHDDTPIGGILQVPVDQPVRSHWIAHLTTPDLEALVRRVRFLQGEVLMDPTALEGVGHTALVADPAGAVLAPFQFDDEPHGHEPGQGPIPWATLLADRPDLASKVYRTLFDWKDKDTVADEAGAWSVFARRTTRCATAASPAEGEVDPQWVPHAPVDDVEAAVARAIDAGATVVRAPAALPRIGTVAIVASDDVVIGLFSA